MKAFIRFSYLQLPSLVASISKDGRKPLAPPVLYECEMEGGRSEVKRIVNPATTSGKTVNRR